MARPVTIDHGIRKSVRTGTILVSKVPIQLPEWGPDLVNGVTISNLHGNQIIYVANRDSIEIGNKDNQELGGFGIPPRSIMVFPVRRLNMVWLMALKKNIPASFMVY